MADSGKYLKLDENNQPAGIVASKPERGVQLLAPGASEDEVAKAHIRAAEEAVKAAKSDSASDKPSK